MKNTLLLSFAMLCWTVSAFASQHTVAGLNASGSSVIIKPGSDTHYYGIQNNGSNDIRVTFDGGASQIFPGGKTGTNPDPTHGWLIKAGTYVLFGLPPLPSDSGSPPTYKGITAIMVTGTTTLEIDTDGSQDIFPTN